MNCWRVSHSGVHRSAQNLPGSITSRILETLTVR
jgi:hypothetical protein